MWARRRRKWRRHSKHFHRSQWVDDLRRIRSSYREMQYAKHITGLVCLILMMKTCAMKLFQNSHVVSLAVMQSLSLFYNLMCIIAQLIGIYVWYVGRHCHHHTYSIFMYQKVTIPFSVLKRRGNQWKWRRRWKYCRRSKHVIDIRKFRSHLLEKQRAIHLLGRVCVTLLVKNIAVAYGLSIMGIHLRLVKAYKESALSFPTVMKKELNSNVVIFFILKIRMKNIPKV
ncbi:uncharacterized protein LOC126282025 isoform X4 [Schistocerca gregaria]|uniref:uncharacterized protein LOC126282025 isoform X4 n=1 Tax=Schistocerca gregaria TaxID=7010 RepID=UPI00211F24BE|nr:uncharacterized protein LOC126282025 isoform X4 [Schistocerca gregaria]